VPTCHYVSGVEGPRFSPIFLVPDKLDFDAIVDGPYLWLKSPTEHYMRRHEVKSTKTMALVMLVLLALTQTYEDSTMCSSSYI
jgi:hypothetical protein